MAGAGGVRNATSPSNLSRSLDRIFEDARLTGELKLSGRKLKDYPKGSFKHDLSDTVIADLSKNRFSELPNEVTTYSSLEQLNLYHNVVKSLPDTAGRLVCLTHLNLSRNQLSTVPLCVCLLSNLRVLNLSGNRLVSLPEEIGNLGNLMELDASYNRLAHLPPTLGDLDELRKLNFRRNLLQSIPLELCFLRLTYLDVSDNRITSLPNEVRFMSSLTGIILDHNPLQQPPTNLCCRGRVHIYKWLEQSAIKEDKKRGVLSEAEFRRLHKPASSELRLINGFFENRHKRSTLDSGYSTSENGEQRWSQESQESLDYEDPRKLPIRAAEYTKEHRQRVSSTNRPSSVPISGQVNTPPIPSPSQSSERTVSAVSTPSTLSPGDGINIEDEFHKVMNVQSEHELPLHKKNGESPGNEGLWSAKSNSGALAPTRVSLESFVFTNSSTHVRSVSQPSDPLHPHLPDPGGGQTSSLYPSPQGIPTYREYLESKKQQRALESTNIYRRTGGDGSSPTTEAPSHRLAESSASHMAAYPRPNPMGASRTSVSEELSTSLSSFKSHSISHDDLPSRADVKAIQKEAVLTFVKARVSPGKGSAPNSPDTSFDSTDSIPLSVNHSFSSSPYSSGQKNIYSPSSPQASITPTLTNGISHPRGPAKPRGPLSNGLLTGGSMKGRRIGGGQSFEPNSNTRMNFTFRRELEKQQHEKQLIDNLRSIIESRLKMALPSDLSSALMDGVVLCHLANHVRPRSVSSIHVPSPAVPKLTIAKCRLNVENFLEACRKIGVEEDYLCSAHDVLEERERGTVRVAVTVERLLQFYQGRHTPLSPRSQTSV